MNTKQNKVAFLILIIGKNKIKKCFLKTETFGSSTVYLVSVKKKNCLFGFLSLCKL